ncbi:hypothetical protein [Bacillus kexueae]|uniref:hypothetical protein n=1 Tax=Aeribacillus kexueae TaxID=2078952 RepID=UPI001FAF4006|nr:hypothetical protein [Bacillus kexueae]
MEILCTPNTKDVEEYLAEQYHNNKKILHIVPTMILYKRRSNFYKAILRNQNIVFSTDQRISDRELSKIFIKHNIYLFELNRFLEYMAFNSGYKVLTKSESAIVLERVMKQNSVTAHSTWYTLLSDIHETFQSFTLSGVSIKELYKCSSNDSWVALIGLYDLYLQELQSLNHLDFGLACNQLLENEPFSDFDKVYIDGAFLPIRPSLHRLINKLEGRGSDVTFFIPVDLDQADNPVFRVLRKTYEPYASIKKWKSIKSNVQQHNVVQKLARNIFSDSNIQIDDHSVEFVEFETVEDEMRAIVARIATLIKQGLVKANKVAIVTPKAMEMRPMVRELAEFYNVQVEIPERPLIQLPFGKLIYFLYKINVDEKISVFGESDHYIDCEMVIDILHLNLLHGSEGLTLTLEQLKGFFEDCTTFNQWYNQITSIKKAKSKINESFQYHPLYYVSEEELNSLECFIINIENLSKQLINTERKTFEEHLNFLINTLKSERTLSELDGDTECRLRDIIDSVGKHQNIKIEIQEFATRIQTIFQDDYKEELVLPLNQVKITVTGPNNVEYQEYDYIYLTRFTQKFFPENIMYKWPMNIDIEYEILKRCTKIDGKNSNFLYKYYLDRSLYYMFVVINAANKKLTISYSRLHEGINQSPAHYLHDIVKVFGIEESIDSEKLEEILKNSKLLLSASPKPITELTYPENQMNFSKIKENSVITIEDIAVYEYCPRRFYYEKQYPEKKAYTNIFQLQNYASSCLYEESVKILVGKFPKISKNNKKVVMISIGGILTEAKEKIQPLFPLGNRYWEDIIIRTRFHIESLINRILSVNEHKNAALSLTEQKAEKEIGGYVFYGERQLKVKYPTVTNYYSISNLKDLLSFSVKGKDEDDQTHLKYVKNTYLDLLRGFCYGNDDVYRKLTTYAEKINKQQFDKRSGGHCYYCTFRQVCMEKEIHQDEVNR